MTNKRKAKCSLIKEVGKQAKSFQCGHCKTYRRKRRKAKWETHLRAAFAAKEIRPHSNRNNTMEVIEK